MIVRRHGGDLLLITQVDHAALAGRIMSAWRADHLPDRPTRTRVLDATARHDIGWLTVDAAPTVDVQSGAPHDFLNAPLSVRQGVWPRAIDLLAADDRYVAALVAHHARTVYSRYAGAPGWAAFFGDMDRRRDDLLARDGIALDQLLDEYAFVGMGDLWSLMYCNAWPEPQSRGQYRATLHLPAAPRAAASGVVGGGRLEITPDPFGGAAVPLEILARRVPARRYESDADLRAEVARAPVVCLAAVAAARFD
jgi:hypothetical protein